MQKQHLGFLAVIIIYTLLFSACSGNSAAAKDNSKDSTYSGENSFSYTIEGKRTAIKDIMNDGDGKNWMALFLNKVKNNAGTGMASINVTNELSKEVFNFSIANSGSTNILHYSPSLSNFSNKKSNEATYMSPKYKNYYGDSVTVTITNITATHVAGTFSGKFISDDDKPVSMAITEGNFDLKFTKENSD